MLNIKIGYYVRYKRLCKVSTTPNGLRAEFAEYVWEVYNSFTINSYQTDNQHILAAAQAAVEE